MKVKFNENELKLHVNKVKEYNLRINYIHTQFKGLRKFEECILTLYYYMDYSIKGISKKLNISRNTTRRVLRKFKESTAEVIPVEFKETREAQTFDPPI